MNKPYITYIAFTRAIVNYCERHGITRGAFALRIGFTGDNAENTISNHLNPNSMKNISHERENMILRELDDRSREIYFSMRAKEWGLNICSEVTRDLDIDMSFHCLADDAMIEGDEAFASVKRALKDGVLTKKEIKAVRKESQDAVDFYQKMVDVAEMKLRGM